MHLIYFSGKFVFQLEVLLFAGGALVNLPGLHRTQRPGLVSALSPDSE